MKVIWGELKLVAWREDAVDRFSMPLMTLRILPALKTSFGFGVFTGDVFIYRCLSGASLKGCGFLEICSTMLFTMINQIKFISLN